MKYLWHLFLGLVFGLCLNAVTIAETIQPQSTQNSFSYSQNSLTSEAHAKAYTWGLKAEEWSRYEELMRGPLGIYSPGLDPLTALGIEARSDEERRHYAELQVQAESHRVEKELAYQLAYDAAWKRLYPILQAVVDLAGASSKRISGDGRLAIFVKEDCKPCDQRVRQMQDAGQSFDIYLIDSHQDDATVRRWATQAGIDPAKIRARTITLNHDGGRWLLMGISGDLPAVVRQADGKWQRE